MSNNNVKSEVIKNFVDRFLRMCFVEFDLELLKSFFAEDTTFVGIDVKKKCDFIRCKNLFCDDVAVRCMGDKVYLAEGSFKGDLEDSFNLGCLERCFSLICIEVADGFLIKHGHFSQIDFMPRDKKQTLIKNLNDRIDDIRSITDNICGGVEICTYDEDSTVKFISEGFSDMLGYNMEDIEKDYEGKRALMVYEEDREVVKEAMNEQLESVGVFSLLYRMRHKNGNIVWVLDKGKLIEGHNGVKDIQSILTDVTVNKLQEDEVKFGKKRYEIALKASGFGMFEYNFDAKTLSFFDNMNDMYDLPNVLEDGMDSFIKRGIIASECEKDYRAMYKSIEDGAESSGCFIRSKDVEGVVHDFELNLTAVYGQDGKLERAIGIRKNVTDFLRLKREKEFASRMIENKTLVMEINVTKNKFEYMDKEWQKNLVIDGKSNFTYCMKEFVDYCVAPEHITSVGEFLSIDYMRKQARGDNFIYKFAYKRADKDDICYEWYESTVSIVKDKSSGDMIARVYCENINDKKEKEIRVLEEQRRYRHMVDKSLYAFEINYSKDIIYKGHEHWYIRNGLDVETQYSKVINDFSRKNLSKEDGDKFLEAVSQEKMLRFFEGGEKNFCYEFKEIFEDGSSRWIECDLYFYEDVSTGDVRCFAYMNDIDERKRQEMQLKFEAEHDAMTGMYNKVMVEERIDRILRDQDEGFNVLFIIDIDYFKNINDNFGHAFGDDVIKEVANVILKAFRNSDVVGRIGGDEFCVFMNGAYDMDIVNKKAEELCKMLCKSYSKDGVELKISASIGVAVAGMHGNSYHKLYLNADSALYIAKNSGKNRYHISN